MEQKEYKGWLTKSINSDFKAFCTIEMISKVSVIKKHMIKKNISKRCHKK